MDSSRDYIQDRILSCDKLFMAGADAEALLDAYDQEILRLKNSFDPKQYPELETALTLSSRIQDLNMQKSYLLGVRDGIGLERLVK